MTVTGFDGLAAGRTSILGLCAPTVATPNYTLPAAPTLGGSAASFYGAAALARSYCAAQLHCA
jgi:hypothetical protein